MWTNSSGDATYITGNVGIGTTTPGSKLEVNGSTKTKFIILNDVSFPRIQADSTNLYLVTGGANDINFFSSNDAVTALMTVKSDGKVGIGTITPSTKLDVVGQINLSSSTQSDQRINFGAGGYMYDNGTTIIIGHN